MGERIVIQRALQRVEVISPGPQGPPGEPGQGMPPGGSAGQVLTKVSGDDFDLVWADPAGGAEALNDLTDVELSTPSHTQILAFDGSGGAVWRNLTGTTLFAAASHTHAIAQVTGLQAALNAKADNGHTHSLSQDMNDVAFTFQQPGQVPVYDESLEKWVNKSISGDAVLNQSGALTLANSGVAAGAYTRPNITVDAKGRVTAASNSSTAISDVTGLQAELDSKAAASHGHDIDDIASLDAELDGKSAVGHGHTFSEISGTVPVAQGGTGQTTASAGLNALLPAQSGNSGKVLQTDGTDASWQTVSGGGGDLADGSAASPGLRFANETNSGLYRHDDSFNSGPVIAVNGKDTFAAWDGNSGHQALIQAETLTLFASSAVFFIAPSFNLGSNNVIFLAEAGGVSAPGISFSDDPDSGLYRATSNEVAIACGGLEVLRFARATVPAKNWARTGPQTPIRFADAGGSNYAALRAPSSVTSYTIDLPSAAPTAGQAMVASSSSALTWADVPRVLGRAHGVTVVNTTTATAVVTVSIPAGAMGTNKAVVLEAAADYLNNSGSNKTLRIEILLGSTVIYNSVTGNLGTSASRRPIYIRAVVGNMGVVDSQALGGYIHIGFADSGDAGLGTIGDDESIASDSIGNAGTIAVDTASAQDLVLRITHSFADPLTDFRLRHATVTLL